MIIALGELCLLGGGPWGNLGGTWRTLEGLGVGWKFFELIEYLSGLFGPL